MINSKKIFTSLVLLTMFFSTFLTLKGNAIQKEVYIDIKVNDSNIKMDSLPYMKENRTFVPIRFVAEALNTKVSWEDSEKKVSILNEDTTIDLFVGKTSATITETVENEVSERVKKYNRRRTAEEVEAISETLSNITHHTLEAAPEILNGRVMVPLRFVAENLECDVKWDPSTYRVLIEKENNAVPKECIATDKYTDDDIIWLSRIVHVEARNLPFEGKLAVANVVLNRIKSNDFPSTIYDVIFEVDYHVQFPPAHKAGFREINPPTDAILASKMAMEGINNISTCLFFNCAPFKSKRPDELYKVINGEYFYF